MSFFLLMVWLLDWLFNILGYLVGGIGLTFGVFSFFLSDHGRKDLDYIASYVEFAFMILAGYTLIHLL